MTFIWCIMKRFLCFQSDFHQCGKIIVKPLPKNTKLFKKSVPCKLVFSRLTKNLEINKDNIITNLFDIQNFHLLSG